MKGVAFDVGKLHEINCGGQFPFGLNQLPVIGEKAEIKYDHIYGRSTCLEFWSNLIHNLIKYDPQIWSNMIRKCMVYIFDQIWFTIPIKYDPHFWSNMISGCSSCDNTWLEFWWHLPFICSSVWNLPNHQKKTRDSIVITIIILISVTMMKIIIWRVVWVTSWELSAPQKDWCNSGNLTKITQLLDTSLFL